MNITKRLLSYIYPVTIEKKQGEYLPTIEINLRNGTFLVDGDKVNYSFGSLHHLFRKAFADFKLEDQTIEKVLILGFGAGSIANILHKELQINCSITGVEIDSVMLDLADKYFDLSTYQNTKIVCQDADTFLHRDHHTYDLIIVDLFIERRVPKKFTKPDFIHQLKKHLNPDNGILFFNRINENALQQGETNSLIQAIDTIMNGNTQVITFSEYDTDNVILVHQNSISNKFEPSVIATKDIMASVN